MPLENILLVKRAEILTISKKHGAKNVRVFGSASKGNSGPKSDVDFLVVLDPGRNLLDLVALKQDLEDLLMRKVDVVTEKSLHWYIRDQVIQQAVSL